MIDNSGDLLPLILIHLPSKSLIRFKSVSKQWSSIISDRDFAIEHSLRNPNPAPSAMFVKSLDRYGRTSDPGKCVSLPGNPTGIPSSFDNVVSDPDIGLRVQSCNGLLDWSRKKEGGFIVCNPTTNDRRVVPAPPGWRSKDQGRFDGVTLVFDPSKSRHYKVVALERYSWSDSYVHIYSSEKNRWELVQYTLHTMFWELYPGVFLNNTVYWLEFDQMFYYNLNSKKFESLEIPISYKSVKYLVKSCGCLFLATPRSNVKGKNVVYVDMYEFDTNERQWSNVHEEVLHTFSKIGRGNVQKFRLNDLELSNSTLQVLSLMGTNNMV